MFSASHGDSRRGGDAEPTSSVRQTMLLLSMPYGGAVDGVMGRPFSFASSGGSGLVWGDFVFLSVCVCECLVAAPPLRWTPLSVRCDSQRHCGECSRPPPLVIAPMVESEMGGQLLPPSYSFSAVFLFEAAVLTVGFGKPVLRLGQQQPVSTLRLVAGGQASPSKGPIA